MKFPVALRGLAAVLICCLRASGVSQASASLGGRVLDRPVQP